MKKIIIPMLAVAFLLSPFSATKAHAITNAEFNQLTPQLEVMLSQLRVVVQNETNLRVRENIALAQITTSLNMLSVRLGQMNSNTPQSELQNIQNQLYTMSNQISSIQNQRATHQAALRNIVNLLSGLGQSLLS